MRAKCRPSRSKEGRVGVNLFPTLRRASGTQSSTSKYTSRQPASRTNGTSYRRPYIHRKYTFQGLRRRLVKCSLIVASFGAYMIQSSNRGTRCSGRHRLNTRSLTFARFIPRVVSVRRRVDRGSSRPSPLRCRGRWVGRNHSFPRGSCLRFAPRASGLYEGGSDPDFTLRTVIPLSDCRGLSIVH